jgi:hypothetical protein
VPAREEEAEALHEALSPGAWHWHRGGSAVVTTIDRRSRTMLRLGGSVACQRSAGEAAGEGMRWVTHRGLDGAPWRGAWSEFHRRAARRGAEKGDEFGRVPGAVAGRVHNGFRLRRRETDVWGLRDTGARLAATQGGKWCGPASQRWAGLEVL